jgi:acetyl-CoA acyltransferase
MRETVIAGYLRTAQSRSRPNDPERDWFYQLRADDLLSMLLPELVQRTGIKSEEIDDCLIGCSLGVSENWAYGGRFPVMLSNLANSVAAKAIDQQCGSSMAAVHIGSMEIMLGYADIVLACGMEHMTRVPRGQAWIEGGHAKANQRLVDEEQYEHWDILNATNMGMTAEKLFSLRNFKKEELDQWAKRSHELAEKAQEEKYFENEIFPIKAKQADGSIKVVDKDQSVRKNASMEALANLKPVFKKGGVITAGNSSPLNAGASAILLMEKSLAKRRNIKPLATIRSIGFAGVDPTIMGYGPVPATKKALDIVNLTPKDIDYWEINEAFSIVVLNCIRELGIDQEIVNIKGGAIALGHPLGATGCRLIGTLARILNEKKARYGCANACVGGGQGVATIIERENYDW